MTVPRRVFITGATGYIGSRLIKKLREHGAEVVALTRDAARAQTQFGSDATGGATVEWVEGESSYGGDWQDSVKGCDAVVNLAGASIGGQRWNALYKQKLRDSRVETTRYIVDSIGDIDPADRPRVLVSTSGVDIYPFIGDMGFELEGDDEEFYNESTSIGETFLARLCSSWEQEAVRATDLGVRVAIARLGLVVGPQSAFLTKSSKPFRFLLGGRLGTGRQWMSWVHVDDVISAIIEMLREDTICGPVNVVAPTPVRNREFAGALGRALNKPSKVPVPAFAVRLGAGELAEYILKGRRVEPAVLQRHGFSFSYSDIDAALQASLG